MTSRSNRAGRERRLINGDAKSNDRTASYYLQSSEWPADSPQLFREGSDAVGRFVDDLSGFSLLTDVFGIGSNAPRNYVQRSDVDDALAIAIGRGQHVVIHGSSKQGKTCLRKNVLDEGKCLVLTCMPGWTLEELHGQILRKAGYSNLRSRTVTSTTRSGLSGKVGAKAKAGGAGEVSAEMGASRERGSQVEQLSEPLDIDLSDANDVISALASIGFNKLVVLEDFHYLGVEAQRQFAVALKAYWDSRQVQVAIVGVWLDRNKLVQFNGDLAGRIASINADHWSPSKLDDVIAGGEEMLRIKFCPKFKRDLLEECYQSVWIVQEVCFAACQRAGIVSGEHGRDVPTIGEGFDVRGAVAELVNASSSRFEAFVTSFSSGGRSDSGVHKWITAAVLVSDPNDLLVGLSKSDMKTFIDRHRDGPPVPDSSLTRTLTSLSSLQARLRINPIIFDYDRSTGLLNIVDRSFLLWLKYARDDLSRLLLAAGLPKSFVRDWMKSNNHTGRHRPASNQLANQFAASPESETRPYWPEDGG